MKTKDNLRTIRNYLPFSIRGIADNLPRDTQEIRLRVSRPVTVHVREKAFFINNSLKLTEKPDSDLLIVTPKELGEMFSMICDYSVYSKQSELINGFITLKGGNRAGICGTLIIQDDRVINIRDITSINLRITRELFGCSDELLSRINPAGGALLCGAPCSGKTTILRDIARRLSYKYRTALIDTRSELAAVYGGVPQNDVGLCDILDGYPRRIGFEHAVRCFSPELIICDELGGEEDALSILNASKSGVRVIASLHCPNRNDLINKPALRCLVKSRAFESCVFLNSGDRVGQIAEVIDTDELC